MTTTVPIPNPAPGNLAAPVYAYSGTAQGVTAAIRDASAQSGMDFDVMLTAAKLESGLNPSAQASTSSASGLFQFIDQTWLDAVRQFGPRHGLTGEAAQVVKADGGYTVTDPKARQRILDLRKNPEIASSIAGDHLRAISDKLGLALGRPPDATEIYLGHVLGGGGASQILQAARTTPNQPAADLLPAAAHSNTTLFYAPDGTPYTVTQFIQHMRGRVGRAYASVGAVMPAGPINLAGTRPAASSLKLASAGGAAASRHARQPLEREAMANLTQVFKQLDSLTRGDKSATRHHGKSQDTLPAGLMATLRGTPAGKAA